VLSLHEDGSTAGFRNVQLQLKKLNDGQSPKKKVMSKELISPGRKNGKVYAN